MYSDPLLEGKDDFLTFQVTFDNGSPENTTFDTFKNFMATSGGGGDDDSDGPGVRYSSNFASFAPPAAPLYLSSNAGAYQFPTAQVGAQDDDGDLFYNPTTDPSLAYYGADALGMPSRFDTNDDDDNDDPFGVQPGKLQSKLPSPEGTMAPLGGGAVTTASALVELSQSSQDQAGAEVFVDNAARAIITVGTVPILRTKSSDLATLIDQDSGIDDLRRGAIMLAEYLGWASPTTTTGEVKLLSPTNARPWMFDLAHRVYSAVASSGNNSKLSAHTARVIAAPITLSTLYFAYATQDFRIDEKSAASGQRMLEKANSGITLSGYNKDWSRYFLQALKFRAKTAKLYFARQTDIKLPEKYKHINIAKHELKPGFYLKARTDLSAGADLFAQADPGDSGESSIAYAAQHLSQTEYTNGQCAYCGTVFGAPGHRCVHCNLGYCSQQCRTNDYQIHHVQSPECFAMCDMGTIGEFAGKTPAFSGGTNKQRVSLLSEVVRILDSNFKRAIPTADTRNLLSDLRLVLRTAAVCTSGNDATPPQKADTPVLERLASNYQLMPTEMKAWCMLAGSLTFYLAFVRFLSWARTYRKQNLVWPSQLSDSAINARVQDTVYTFESDHFTDVAEVRLPHLAHFMHAAAVCRENAVDVASETPGDVDRGGVALFYDAFSFLDHTCNPNVECRTRLMQEKMPKMTAKVNRDVSRQGVLTVSYIDDVLNKNVFLRKAELFYSYHFSCKCDKCKKDIAAHFKEKAQEQVQQ